jgi:hypothetical protein
MKTVNPYLATAFNEQSLFSAMNEYHKLDKSNNVNQNKAFAKTIFSDSM